MIQYLLIIFVLLIMLYGSKEYFISQSDIDIKKQDYLGLRGHKGDDAPNKQKNLTSQDKNKIRTFAKNLTYDSESESFKYFGKPLTCLPSITTTNTPTTEAPTNTTTTNTTTTTTKAPINCILDHVSVILDTSPNCSEQNIQNIHRCSAQKPYCLNYIQNHQWGTCSETPGDTCDGNHYDTNPNLKRKCPANKPMCYRKNNDCKKGKCYAVMDMPIYTKNFIFDEKTNHGAGNFASLDSMKDIDFACENRGGNMFENSINSDAINNLRYKRDGNARKGYWELTCNPNLNGKLENTITNDSYYHTWGSPGDSNSGIDARIYGYHISGAKAECIDNKNIGSWKVKFKDDRGRIRTQISNKCVSPTHNNVLFEKDGEYGLSSGWQERNRSIAYFDRLFSKPESCKEKSQGLKNFIFMDKNPKEMKMDYTCQRFRKK